MTVSLGRPAVVDFRLRVSAVELDGIVVTGTPIAAELREVGNSISVLSAEQIEELPGFTIEEILQGRTLGLVLSGSPSQPGAASGLILRGVNSIWGRNQPLVYVDGVRIFSEAWETASNTAGENTTGLGGVAPRDIERIEVIKGAAASTLYGSEAAAGVVQIFTKRGRLGAPRWTLHVGQSISSVGHVGPEEDPTGLHINDCSTGGPFRPDQTEPDPGCPSSGSWLKRGHRQRYSAVRVTAIEG